MENYKAYAFYRTIMDYETYGIMLCSWKKRTRKQLDFFVKETRRSEKEEKFLKLFIR